MSWLAQPEIWCVDSHTPPRTKLLQQLVSPFQIAKSSFQTCTPVLAPSAELEASAKEVESMSKFDALPIAFATF